MGKNQTTIENSMKPGEASSRKQSSTAANDFIGAGNWIAQNSRILFAFVGFELLVLLAHEIHFSQPLRIERVLMLGIPLLIMMMMKNLTQDSAKPGLVNVYHMWSTILFLVTAGTLGYLYKGDQGAALLAFCVSCMAFLVGLSFYYWNWFVINIAGLIGILAWAIGPWYLRPENLAILFQSCTVVFISAIFCRARVKEFNETIVQSSAWDNHKLELQAAVNSAKESTTRFQKIYEGSFEGIVLHKAGYIIDCNPALLDIFQVPKEAILNQNILKLLGREGDGDLLNSLMICENESQELRTQLPNGEPLHLEVLSKIIHSEEGDITATALRNVTARKLAEESIVAKNAALEKQFNRQKALAEWSSMLDKKQDIQSMSGIILKYLHDLLPATAGVFFGIRTHRNGSWRVFVARNGKVEPESWASDKNKPYRELAEEICHGKLTLIKAPEKLGVQQRAFAALPLELHGGRQAFIMVQDMNLTKYTNQDIDFLIAVANRFALGLENSKMVEDLVDAKEAAEAGSRAKSQFLATLSHELRTPLNGIIGSCQILEMSLENEEDLSSVMTVRNSSEAMTNMVDRILSFTQIAGDGVELHSVEFSVDNLISDVVDSLESLKNSKKLTFDVDVDEAVPSSWNSDFHSCKTVLLNLAENALKFTDVGGVKVRVTLKPIQQHSVQTLLFEVYDSGCGFDPDQVNELFEPFSQGDGSHSRKHGGLGLGLAVCKALTGRLGGKIGCKPTKQGSVFWYEVPFGISSSSEMDSAENMFAKLAHKYTNKSEKPEKPTFEESDPKTMAAQQVAPVEPIAPVAPVERAAPPSMSSDEDLGSFELGSDPVPEPAEEPAQSEPEPRMPEFGKTTVESGSLDDPGIRTMIVESSPFIRMALMKYFEKAGIKAEFVKDLSEVVPHFAVGNSNGIHYPEVLVSEKLGVDALTGVIAKVAKISLPYNPVFKRMIRSGEGGASEPGAGIKLEPIGTSSQTAG